MAPHSDDGGRLHHLSDGDSCDVTSCARNTLQDFGDGDTLLTIDLTVPCPTANKASFLFLTGTSFAGIYIFGIPVFFYVCMRLFGIPAMAQVGGGGALFCSARLVCAF